MIQADLDNLDHQNDVVTMTQAYAHDAMGNNGPLSTDVLERLIPALRTHPTTVIFLAYDVDRVVGIATCFVGFSTFAARPLLNIHDLAVLASHRGRGIGRLLLATVEREARSRGYVKLTLEVVENNRVARTLYEETGFTQAVYGSSDSGALFYSKSL